MQNPSPRLISCDEAGYTGPNLRDANQPVFTYASVDLTRDEASSIVNAIRSKYRIQSPELKSSLLRRRPNWPEIALEVASYCENRAIVIAFDKRLSLGGKIFEYIFEPVLEENNVLFYKHNLHRFTMNMLYRVMYASDRSEHELAAELNSFLRSFDPSDAPTIFSSVNQVNDASIIIDCLLRFSRGYAAQIAASTTHLRAGGDGIGKWALDLTNTALFSLLFLGWGHRHPQIELLCDESKPLKAMETVFNAWVGQGEASQITDGMRWVEIRGNLAKPVVFDRSEDHPTIQIADVLAGATVDAIRLSQDDKFSGLASWVHRHLHVNHILPDEELIDTRAVGPRVNLAVLRELARRADCGQDPIAGMEKFYQSAFKRYRSPAARIRPNLSKHRKKGAR